jgi:hypothetical protein
MDSSYFLGTPCMFTIRGRTGSKKKLLEKEKTLKKGNKIRMQLLDGEVKAMNRKMEK